MNAEIAQRSQYYVGKKAKLLKELDGFAKLMRPELAARYGEQAAADIHRATLAQYQKLIPLFPYIGGSANPLTTNLVQAGFALALYRALQAQGGTVEETGELIHLALERRLMRIPGFVRRLIALIKIAPWNVRRMQQRARRSQERRYPEDWVYTVVLGDEGTFDVGIDYTECGIEKFMRRQGASELTPYLCNTDYVLYRAFGMGLARTKTLAWGCDGCDFRIKRTGNLQPAWPPLFVERHGARAREPGG
jgi:hypothetical protein